MVDISGSRFRVRWALSAAAALLLAGCAHVPGIPLSWDQPPAQELSAADQTLAQLQAFATSTPAERSRMYADTVGDLAVEPSPGNRLRLAALQGWPGHPHSRPADAVRMLDRLLEEGELDAEAHDLALVLKFWIAQRGTDQRLQRSLQARIAELERELEETREQLSALAEIERMIDPDLCHDDCPQDRDDPAR